ncbi:MFS transporter [Burkholderia sp. FL-7-2-10-S1-D7]|uniref:MFS transporter n=1 Tax=Burkholderia sp. FL-7-2-10-S1-D7 TaxID=1637866 RepID=UPI0007587F85|nr:MFS transporter [Burkholderia sp. FL-7-2-10-S1-D7]KVF78423.1 MFS transporter [Burkholderia sp. FL-7-2-10-S1-D7]
MSPLWRTVASLNAVSACSQIAQFGLGFIVLPVWLASRGLDASQVGLFSSAQSAGMLAGLAGAPALLARVGAKRTVMLALAATLAGFAAMSVAGWPLWVAPGALIGLGLGLRWIGNETWLYGLVPPETSGRVVGVHEALIGIGGVVAPAFAAASGVDGPATFAAGAGLTLLAALPLALTPYDPRLHVRPCERNAPSARHAPLGPLVGLGIVVAAVGGLCDGALYGLLSFFSAGHGMTGARATTLLTLFGVGAIAMQFPVGWLVDRAGLAVAIVTAATVGTAAALGLAFSDQSSWPATLAAIALGGATSAFLTLGMCAAAAAHTDVPGRAMRLISLAFGVASIAGPLVASTLMKAFGSDTLMTMLALSSGMLATYVLGVEAGRRSAGRARLLR